ncbi:MAG: MarR family winged helix-turn-helix transcriptional regulator [Proteobacteria bacterium]|nr:MarR family winged helix-turn-helix transcriptional regulator [Pseudomonadota bacterium]
MANPNPFLWWLPSPTDTKVERPAAPALPDVHAKPGHLIRRAQQIAVAIFLEECAAYDLTPVQYAALVAIRDNPAIDATRISGLIGFDRTTVSGVMERLESKGWIARKANAADRRIKIVDITAAGKKVLKNVEPMVMRAQERMLMPLDRTEQEMLIVLLARVVDHNNDTSRAPQRPLGQDPG